MKFLSTIEAEVLLDFFGNWARATTLGDDLVRTGAVSARKRWCGLWQAVVPPLTLKECAFETQTGVSDQTLAQWRRDPVFRGLADEAARQFAWHLGEEVAAAAFGDKIRGLVLTSLWVRLPGFDIAKNQVVEEINKATGELNKNLTKRNIMRLYNLFVAFRDTLRFAQEHLKFVRWQEIENKAYEVISQILEIYEAQVKVARENGLFDNVTSEGLLNIVTSIEFLCAYSQNCDLR